MRRGKRIWEEFDADIRGHIERLTWLDELWQDIHYGLRMLHKTPGFTAVAVLTMALGIGANTAIFSLIDAVMLRSLPVEKPSELVVLKWKARKEPRIHGYMFSDDCPSFFTPTNPVGCSFSEPMFREIRNTNQFAGVAAFANTDALSLTGNGPTSMISGQLVSGDFFATMGVKAVEGRVLEMSDDSSTASPVAVLNYGFWQRAFGGAREAVGRTMELNGSAFIIVGVAEQRFTGISPGTDYDVWLPLSAGPRITEPLFWNNRQDDVSYWWLMIVGRMKKELPLVQAEAAISGVFRNQMLYESLPLFDEGAGRLSPLDSQGASGPTRSQMVPAPGPAAALPGPRAEPVGAELAIAGPRPAQGPTGGEGTDAVTVQGAIAAPSNQGPTMSEGPPGAPMKALQGKAPAEVSEPRTLWKLDDEPAITFVNAQTGLTGARSRFENPLYVLMSAVAIILLIACSNVAGLMLARSAMRQKEVALRLALGAWRARIVRQLLTESVMLAATGGILGIVFALWGAHAILSFVSTNQPRSLTFAVGLDLRVLGFTTSVSLFTGVLFGLAPAFRGTRVDVTPALKEGFSAWAKIGHSRRFSLGNALVVAQVALAIIVLIGAGLMVRTLQNLRSIDVGFDSHNLVLFGIDPTLAGYKGAQVDSFYRDLQGRLAETPGVKSASYSLFPLLSGEMTMTRFHLRGMPQDRQSYSDVLWIGPNFFSTMHIPFVAGRDFSSSDYEIAASKPPNVPTPVIVNQVFLAAYLGKEVPLGRRFGESAGSQDEPASPGYEIVGVVRDTKYSDLRREIKPLMYMPQSGRLAAFEVRTTGNPQALVPVMRRTVAQIDPNLPLHDVTTESQQIERLLFRERLVVRLSGFLGLLALTLACIGLYGLLAYEVALRTREIGIRTALGAQKSDVLRLVVKQGLTLALTGAFVGVGVAIGVTRYLKAMLYDVPADDPATIVVIGALLILVALAACIIPARRATSVDPMVSLRYE